MSIGIDVQYSIAHVRTQNGLDESFIKRLQLIVKPLLLNTKLPLLAWRHAIIHAANLIRLRPIANQDLSPLQLVLGYQPNISHLHVVVFMFPLHPFSELNKVLNVVLVFLFVFNLHLLLTILSLS